jgi:hypothetical protein
MVSSITTRNRTFGCAFALSRLSKIGVLGKEDISRVPEAEHVKVKVHDEGIFCRSPTLGKKSRTWRTPQNTLGEEYRSAMAIFAEYLILTLGKANDFAPNQLSKRLEVLAKSLYVVCHISFYAWHCTNGNGSAVFWHLNIIHYPSY